jgi:hypothetical protein
MVMMVPNMDRWDVTYKQAQVPCSFQSIPFAIIIAHITSFFLVSSVVDNLPEDARGEETSDVSHQMPFKHVFQAVCPLPPELS